ncbi:LPS-assembly protein LptD [Celeribacter sp. ULVN23_4]
MTASRPAPLPRRPRPHLRLRPLKTLAQSAALGVSVFAPLSAGLGLIVFDPTPAIAQQDTAQSTALMADSVAFDGVMLVATGSVEVLRGDQRLTASRIAYNQNTGAMTIDGPIRLTQGDGDTVILASAAEIDTELKNGLLTSARMVIARQMQLAASRLDVVEGRYTRLQNTVASTCEVCASRPVPLWEIRARDVIHDNETRQLYFTDAHLRVVDIPVLWLPHLRVPDPTLDRANGFLIPEISSDSTLGTGVKIPYFITLGDSRDLTVTPYLATGTTTMNLRYRQAFWNGELEVNGALSSDDTSNGLRAYISSQGTWELAKGLTLDIDLNAVSDTSYLADYNISDSDYLTSSVRLSRFRTGEALDLDLAYSRYLGDNSATRPAIIGEFAYEKYLDPSLLPGRLSFGVSSSAYYRESDQDVDGGDVLRIGAESTWSGSHIFSSGLRLDNSASMYTDAYFIRQYSSYDSEVLRLTGSAETKLSWPLSRSTATGASEILEPILQVGWSDSIGGSVPDTDSNIVEFDEGNLLTLARFSGSDERETGWTSAAGLRFAHYGETLDYAITLGRVLYLEDTEPYSDASGLSTTASDWLIAGGIRFNEHLSLSTRSLISTDAELTKSDTRLDYVRDRYSIGTTYSYVIADALEDRDEPINEFAFDGEWQLTDTWSLTGEYRHDYYNEETTRTGLGVKFENECTRINLGLTRRYWETDDLDPTTRFTFSVGFGAFGENTNKADTCAF